MYIINNEDGRYALIDNRDTANNKVSYTFYEHDGKVIESTSGRLKTINMQDLIKSTGLTDDIIYNAMLLEVDLSGFVLSTDTQNWLESSKLNRMIVPLVLIAKSKILQDDLDGIMTIFATSAKTHETKKIVICTSNCVVYYNDITTEDYAIIEPYITYGAIKIETKLT